MDSDERKKELLSTLFTLRGAEFSRCFAPPPFCPNAAIRAHSVQNARCLDLIASDGHVIAPNLRLAAEKAPAIDLAPVGRNRATTFSGLCEKHDRQIFASIETGPINVHTIEHRFLLAYRATFYEVHATCAAASQVQLAYQKRAQLGFDPADAPSEAGLLATHRIIVAYETFRYKEGFDEAYLKPAFDILEHDLITFDVARPTVAACALFSFDHLRRDDHSVGVCLNILPIEQTKTIVLLSYLRSDAPLARTELHRILTTSGDLQKYEVSRRLLNNCQNFVLSPSYVASWTPAKRQIILDYFVRTLLYDDLEFEHADLCLF